LQEIRIKHRQTKDAQRVRALMEGCDNEYTEEDTGDEGDLAPVESGVASAPAPVEYSFTAASRSSTLSSRGADENDATFDGELDEEGRMLAYLLDGDEQRLCN